MSWDAGCYERTAQALMPAAEEVVDVAAIELGERVVDVGCGTGNAAVLAAARGARVVGVDPAARLLAVARAEALARGLTVRFATGDAAALPVADGSADAVVSVFGVIFAPDVAAAAAELGRVTAPTGRIVLSTWLPVGAVTRVMAARAQALAAVTGRPPVRPFPWHEPAALADAFAGFEIDMTEHGIAFSAASPEAYVDQELREHPTWIAARDTLEPSGALALLREQITEILRSANEDPDGFRITSRYAVARLRRR